MTDDDKTESDLILVIDTEFSPDITKLHWDWASTVTSDDRTPARYNVIGAVTFYGV